MPIVKAKIEGQENFKGRSWHTSRWPDSFDMKGKRVAVIGTGATGYQMIPELALDAKHVTVFQRTPQWLFEAPGYRSPFPPQINWLDRNLPYHTNFMRLRTSLAIEFAHLIERPVEVIIRCVFDGAIDRRRWIAPRAIDLPFGHKPVLDQIVEHDIGARARRRQIYER